MPFEIIETDPIVSQLDVSLNKIFKLTFSSELDNSYLSQTNIGSFFQLYKLPNNTKVGVAGGKDPNNSLNVFIKPLLNLDPDSEYMFIFLGGNNGLKNIANEKMAKNKVLTFRTGIDLEQLTIDIVDGIVVEKTPPTPIPPTTPPIAPVTIPPINSVNNKVNSSESGTYFFGPSYAEDEIDPLSVSNLYLTFSSPRNKQIGVKNLNKIVTNWTKNVTNIGIEFSSLNQTNLPFEHDLFGDHEIQFSNVTLENNKVIFFLEESGIPTLNKEYVLNIEKGSLHTDTDNTELNNKSVIRFMGPLEPLFSTPDDVKTLMSRNLDPSEIDNIDDYTLYKLIHQNSIGLIKVLGKKPNIENDEIYWAFRYVTCKTAFDLSRGPLNNAVSGKTVISRDILGQSTRWGFTPRGSSNIKRKSPLEECMNEALISLGLSIGAVPEIGIKSVNSEYYPGRNRRFE